jgi:ribose transport system substrate-binding protein
MMNAMLNPLMGFLRTKPCSLGPLVLLAVVLAGCPQSNPQPPNVPSGTNMGASGGNTGGGAAPGGKRWKIGFSQANSAEPWRTAMNNSMKAEAARHAEIELLPIADAQQDNAKQVADVENFLQQGIDLLIISPNEAKPLTAVVKKAWNGGNGIPVIVLDRDISEPTYTMHIGADNKEIGRMAGKFIVETLGGKGNMVEIWGLKGSPPAWDRHNGMMEEVKKAPGIKIVADCYGDWLREKGRQQFESVLPAQPKIDLVYAHNDPMAIGAFLGAQAVGREKAIKFVGIDALSTPDGGIKAVMDGKLAATFLYPNCGKEAIQNALKILNKEPFEKKVVLPTATITKENAAEHYQPSG